jgi:hypothetical protein
MLAVVEGPLNKYSFVNLCSISKLQEKIVPLFIRVDTCHGEGLHSRLNTQNTSKTEYVGSLEWSHTKGTETAGRRWLVPFSVY